MGFNNLSANVKITKVKAATAAGTTDINSDGVDMQDFEGVMFIVTFGTITASAVTSIQADQSTDNSSFDALKDTKVVVAADDDNQTFFLDIYRPLERYLRLTVDRATQNAVVGEIYAIQYGASIKGIIQNVTDKVTGELHTSPIEGTP